MFLPGASRGQRSHEVAKSQTRLSDSAQHTVCWGLFNFINQMMGQIGECYCSLNCGIHELERSNGGILSLCGLNSGWAQFLWESSGPCGKVHADPCPMPRLPLALVRAACCQAAERKWTWKLCHKQWNWNTPHDSLPTGKSTNAVGGPLGSGLIYLLALPPAAVPPYALRWDVQFC